MAVKKTPSRKSKPAAPASLTLNLFEPGMTPIHRAGLGGLAATLKALERRVKRGLLREEEIPGAPWPDNQPPWSIDDQSLTLNFGEPGYAGEYLRRLFRFAFGIKDKLIDLPGTYTSELSRAVRAELQHGLTLTFLQFGPHRSLAPEIELRFDVEGNGTAGVVVHLRPCSQFLHQDGVSKLKLVEKNDSLRVNSAETPSAFNPGAVVRHNSFKTATQIEESAGLGLCASFAAVGCLSLAINKGAGVLLVPEVTHLDAFAISRPQMTPTTPRECRIAGASDAALQANLRIRGKQTIHRHGVGIGHLNAMRLQPTQWNEKQKSRVHTAMISRGNDELLQQYQVALQHLPPKIRSREEVHKQGRGEEKITIREPFWFWRDSVIRSLIADNLALIALERNYQHYWYTNFTSLMRDTDSSGNPLYQRVAYETKGLHDMIYSESMTAEDELALIRAIHQAIKQQLGRIYSETMGKAAASRGDKATQAVKNRWNRHMERLRLSLINTKTAEQTREQINLILLRAGSNQVFKQPETLQHVHRLLFQGDWKRARDLAMLAVASYQPSQEQVSAVDTDEN